MLVSTHHGGVQEHEGQVELTRRELLVLHAGSDAFRHTGLNPAAPTHVDRMPVAVVGRQVPPWAAKAHAVKHGFKDVAAGNLLRKALLSVGTRKEPFDALPSFVAQCPEPLCPSLFFCFQCHPCSDLVAHKNAQR